MNKIIIIGDSGHSKVIEDIVKSHDDYTIIAKLDDRYDSKFKDNGMIKAPINDVYSLLEIHKNAKVVIAIGANHVRKKIVEKLGLNASYYASLIHSTAVISDRTQLGLGTVVMPCAIINADVSIGNHVIINSGAVVEHDCMIEDYVHISPGTVLTGNVSVKEGAHVGAGSSIIPMKTIGEWSTIGAGATVIKDVLDRTTVAGVPAKVIKER